MSDTVEATTSIDLSWVPKLAISRVRPAKLRIFAFSPGHIGLYCHHRYTAFEVFCISDTRQQHSVAGREEAVPVLTPILIKTPGRSPGLSASIEKHRTYLLSSSIFDGPFVTDVKDVLQRPCPLQVQAEAPAARGKRSQIEIYRNVYRPKGQEPPGCLPEAG